MADRAQLIDAAMALRGAAPQEWAKFAQAMIVDAAQTNADMMRADPALLLRAQGMAVFAKETADLLANVSSHYEKLYEARMKQNVRSQQVR